MRRTQFTALPWLFVVVRDPHSRPKQPREPETPWVRVKSVDHAKGTMTVETGGTGMDRLQRQLWDQQMQAYVESENPVISGYPRFSWT